MASINFVFLRSQGTAEDACHALRVPWIKPQESGRPRHNCFGNNHSRLILGCSPQTRARGRATVHLIGARKGPFRDTLSFTWPCHAPACRVAAVALLAKGIVVEWGYRTLPAGAPPGNDRRFLEPAGAPTGSKRRRPMGQVDHSPRIYHRVPRFDQFLLDRYLAMAICSGTVGRRLRLHLHRDGCRSGLQRITAIGSRPIVELVPRAGVIVDLDPLQLSFGPSRTYCFPALRATRMSISS